MQRTFTLRVPFQLVPGQHITDLGEKTTWNIEDYIISLEQIGDYFVLIVENFSTEEEARFFFYRIQNGLAWLLLNLGVGFIVEKEFETIIYADNTDKATENLRKMFNVQTSKNIDGLANGNMPVIYETNKNIRFAYFGSPTLSTGVSKEKMIELLSEGVLIRDAQSLPLDDKLQTAIELFDSYFYEKSNKARFLALMMALEALAETKYKPPIIVDLIEKWKEEVDNKKQTESIDSEEHAALEALERELLFRKETSIRSQIRALVLETLRSANHPDANSVARQALKIYDKRSTLVHEGRLPEKELRESIRIAKNIVEIVLKIKLKQKQL